MNVLIHIVLGVIGCFTIWMLWQFSREWEIYANPKKNKEAGGQK